MHCRPLLDGQDRSGPAFPGVRFVLTQLSQEQRRDADDAPAGSAATPSQRAGTRRLLASLLLAAAIPILLFAGWRVHVTAARDREDAQRQVVTINNRVAELVTSELLKELEIAEALVGSVALDQPDLPRFYEEARRLTAARPLWNTVALTTPEGVPVLNILKPLGHPLSPPPERLSFEETIRSNRARIGGIGPVEAISGKRLVSLHVPVTRDDRLRYVLTVALVPSGISAILRSSGAPQSWVGAILDAEGRIVARTLKEDTEIGREVRPAVMEMMKLRAQGFYLGETFEGVPVETVFRRLARPEGWSVHFGIPADELNAPILMSTIVLMAGALASCILGGSLVWLVARDYAHRRNEETALTALALRLSEERGAVAIEAAELGLWSWDSITREMTGSARFCHLLDLPGAATGASEAVWSAERFNMAIVEEDRPKLEEALRDGVARNRPIDMELRVLRRDGRRNWIRLIGRKPVNEHSESAIITGVIADVEQRKRTEAERMRLLQALSEAQETERRGIARELHDQVGQAVTGLSLGLKSLERTVASQVPGASKELVVSLQNLAQDIGRDIHRVASNLRPTAIDDLGLGRALSAYLDDWSRLTGVAVDCQLIGLARPLPLPVETTAYRVVQEAATNVVKHACASHLSVVVDFRDETLILIIEDDGNGVSSEAMLEADQGAGRPRLGIVGMRERLAVLGGTLNFETSPRGGLSLFVAIPISRPERDP